VVFIPYYLLRGEIEILKDRLGMYDIEDSDFIWLHSASVGEIKIAQKLIEELRKKTMQPILVTVVTKSGYKLFQNFQATKKTGYHNVYLKYAPFDFLPIILNLINKLKIQKFIAIETEIWASYIFGCFLENVPRYIANARISDKSYPKYSKYKFFFTPILQKFNTIFAQSKENKKRFVSLGANIDRVVVIENIKYDLIDVVDDINHEKSSWFAKRSVWTAGSIRSGEEKIVIQTFIDAKTEVSDLLLIIAPRHLENVPKIIKMLTDFQLSFILLSDIKNGKIKNIEQDVLVVDLMGELVNMYKNSDLVFVGGSLVNKGGQNIIEPASLGKLVLFGPNMQNFKEIAEKFLEAKGAIKVKNQKDLTEKVIRYLTHKDDRCHIVHKVLKCLKESKGGAQKTVEYIFNK
jgi:3-deoxy-D-manno-octulosonic-acid transferase